MGPGGAGIPQGSIPGAVPELSREPLPCSSPQPGSIRGSRGAPRDQICGKSWDLGRLKSWAQVRGHFPAHPSRLRGNPGMPSSRGSGRGRLFPRCFPGDGAAGFREAEPDLTPLSPPQVSASMEAAPAPQNPTGASPERGGNDPQPPDSPGDPKNFRNGAEGGAAGAAWSRRNSGLAFIIVGSQVRNDPGFLEPFPEPPGAASSRERAGQFLRDEGKGQGRSPPQHLGGPCAFIPLQRLCQGCSRGSCSRGLCSPG